MSFLRQNGELVEDGIWNWTLPAWITKLADGRVVNVCPSAGACKEFCYARNGTYLFPAVQASHKRNLRVVLDQPALWQGAMIGELRHKRFRPTGRPRFTEDRDRLITEPWVVEWMDSGGAAVRVHDSGDFFSDDYLDRWIAIAEAVPDVLFYAYTKEVTRVRNRIEIAPLPVNFRIIYSLGGVQDYLLDFEEDRHAEVFPDMETLVEAGYEDQEDSDLLCVLLATPKVGIPANNIPAFRKAMGDQTFGGIEKGKKRNRSSIKAGVRSER